ncbi:MAG TPA: hypothetical protein VFZ53_12360 [Polyangiaceae bacterium]
MRAFVRRATAAGVGLAALAGGTAGCQDAHFGSFANAACPHFGGQTDLANARISANARANAKIRTFLIAARDVSNVSVQMEAQATQACRAMGRDLGVSDAQMAPRSNDPGAAAQAACGAVSAQIDGILRQGVEVRVQATPPACQANASAKARCDAACDVELDPGAIVAQCEPARLSGYCRGQCRGRCDGTCNGQCQGTCSARDAQGNCAGQCQGTCTGTCSATCHASCQGQWEAPKCEGMVRPPSADADCNASCSAHAELSATCQPGRVEVQGTENVDMALRLAATLRANLPLLLHAEIALGKRIAGSVKTVVDVGAQLPRVVGEAGAEGLACIAAGSNASVQASMRINVSIQASASVTGRVGANAG